MTSYARALMALVLTMMACLVSTALSQTETATISGRVTDASGAIVLGAEVQLQSIERGTSQQSRSNDAGIYSLAGVQPGQYHLTIRKTGFKTIDFVGLVVNVQDHIEKNFQLQLGSVSESVTVNAEDVYINTTDAAVSTVVDRRFVKELPLNGRSFQTLFQLTPGVVIANTSYVEQGQFSVNGQRTNANYIQVDGVSANVGVATGSQAGQSIGGSLPALTAGGGTNGIVSVDALQEFALQTSTYSAEYGRTPGAQVSIITRSGTNEFHGDVFDYFRNDVLDANDWFANVNGLKRSALRQNDFGAVLGGPIRKNRTFAFVSYEALRLIQPTTALTDVPSLAARQAAPPSIQPFLKAFPLPTRPDEGDGLSPANYAFSNPSQLDTGSIRIDHHLTRSLSLFGRYNYSSSYVDERTAGNVDSINTNEHIPLSVQTLTFGATWVGASLTNDGRFNWSSATASTTYSADTYGGAGVVPLSTVIPSSQRLASSAFAFEIDSGNGTQLFAGPVARNQQRQLNVVDNLSWQLRSHSFKTGVDFRSLTPVRNGATYQQLAEFSDVPSVINDVPEDAILLSFAGPVNATYRNYSIFGQDAWKVNRRLTISYGLRWDYNPTPSGHGANGLLPLVVVATNNLANLSVSPPGTPLYHATKDNFAPRLGLAYNVSNSQSHNSVVRAGFGVFYDLGNGPTGNVFDNSPFTNLSFRSPDTFPLTATDAAPPPVGSMPPFSRLLAFPGTLRQPYTYHWNVSYEQALGSNQSFTVGYVASAGHSLLRQDQVQGSPPLPGELETLDLVSNQGYSHYNSLQAQFRRRQANGLEVLASYTYAHSLDNVSGDSQVGTPSAEFSPTSDYSSSDFDVRHTGSVALDYELQKTVSVRWVNLIIGGWAFNTLLLARSAPPVNIVVFENAGFGRNEYRPNVVAGVPQYIQDANAPGGIRINAQAFALPGVFQEGNLGRNALRGFGLFQQDFSVRRSFSLTEKVRLQARLEAFNLWNHPNFASESGILGSVGGGSLHVLSSFGLSQSMFATGANSGGNGSGFNPLYQVGGPRSLQLALKLEF